MTPRLPAALLAAAAVLVLAGAATRAQDSPAVAAMQDELDRSMKSLRIEDEPPPYYISYHMDELTTTRIAGRLGAIEVNEPATRMRTLSVEVRVGDYDFDSSRFVTQGRGGFGAGGDTSEVAALDDDYDAIRRQLWLATDRAYKRAVTTFARKKAAFQNRAGGDALPDFSRETPVQTIEPPAAAAPRTIDWVERAARLSAILRVPHVHSSAVSIAEQRGMHYFINSEGFRVATPINDASFVISADTQADDGMGLRAAFRLTANRLEDFPPVGELEAAAAAVAERLRIERAAPIGEEYTGPVLFEGRAGAEVIAQSFVPLFLAQRPPDTDNPRAPRTAATPFLSRIGLRVISDSFSIADTPSLRQFAGRPVAGAYEVDDEGVPAQDVALVENGRLVTLLTSRAPQRRLLQSNGHGRGSGAQAGVVQVRSARAVPAAILKQRYLELLRLQEKPFGYIVRGLDAQGLPHIVRINSDGSEEAVRGLRVGNVPSSAFRDILEASSEQSLFNYRTNGGPVSVIAPALLFEEIEIQRENDIAQKPPIVPSPLQ